MKDLGENYVAGPPAEKRKAALQVNGGMVNLDRALNTTVQTISGGRKGGRS